VRFGALAVASLDLSKRPIGRRFRLGACGIGFPNKRALASCWFDER